MGGNGLAYSGAVYNGYLHRYMSWSTAGLRDVLADWNRKSRIARFFAHLSLITNHSLRNQAIQDLIEARRNPSGETASKINWKLDRWSHEGVPVGV